MPDKGTDADVDRLLDALIGMNIHPGWELMAELIAHVRKNGFDGSLELVPHVTAHFHA